MKIKNIRSNSKKVRLLHSFCVSAIVVGGICGVLIVGSVLLNRTDSMAQVVTVRNDGENGYKTVGENQVHIVKEKVNFREAVPVTTGDSIIHGNDLEIVANTLYQDEDYVAANGSSQSKFDAERSTHYSIPYRPGGSSNDARFLHYKNSIPTNTVVNVDGYVYARFPKAARLQNGEECDILMKISNITIKTTNYGFNYGYALTGGVNTIAMASYPLLQEEEGSFYVGKEMASRYAHSNSGAAYDIEFSVVEAGTTTPVNKKMVWVFRDIDIKDGTNGNKSYSEGGDYAEAARLISGFNETMYTEADTSLGAMVDNGNTVLYGVSETTASAEDAYVATRVEASGFKYRWSGSGCATALGFIDSFKLTTSVDSGSTGRGTITEPDDEVLWKETKTVTATPKRGYKITKFTVDGVDIDISGVAEGDPFSYTGLPPFTSDHDVVVVFEPIAYKVTTRHYVVDKDGNKTTTKVDGCDDVVQNNKPYGSNYTTSACTANEEYDLYETPTNATGTVNGDIVVDYYYKKKSGSVTVRYCDKATKKCDLLPVVNDEGEDGDESGICVPKDIEGYSLVDKNATYNCVYSKDGNVVDIWYDKISNPVTYDGIDLSRYLLIAGSSVSLFGLITLTLKKNRN